MISDADDIEDFDSFEDFYGFSDELFDEFDDDTLDDDELKELEF